ncbi:hypothetical protein Atai01_33760 [Amycolatopsis taiwanensis]|uniref:Uncharacterized protein n=1 Tax=Amycolatopsis taiwanensis TaxID=342230 RepID=A0A9W6VGS3_9PSEU|nr:hypothetical protein Atai01_33760 [Amycolatopsis taiwanensis]
MAGVELSTPRAALAMLLSLGWPVYADRRTIFLSTTSGFCGLKVPGEAGERMLLTLRDVGVEGPVIAMPWPQPSHIFLADADEVLDTATVSRLGGVLLQTPSTIPLPPSETPRGRLTWLVPPRPANRWLPAMSTVKWALTMTR